MEEVDPLLVFCRLTNDVMSVRRERVLQHQLSQVRDLAVISVQSRHRVSGSSIRIVPFGFHAGPDTCPYP